MTFELIPSCPDLLDILGMATIPKKEIFNEFKVFMFRKTISEIANENNYDKMLEQKKAQLEQQKKREAEEAQMKKKKEEEKRGSLAAKSSSRAIDRHPDPPRPQVRSPVLTEPYNPDSSPRSEEEQYDFYGSYPKSSKEISKEPAQKVSKVDTSKKPK